MKTFTPELTATYQAPTSTLATAWKIVLRDGTTYGLTDHDQDVTIDGLTYYASGGLAPTSVDSTADFEGDTIDVTAFLSVGGEAALQAGDWDDAEVTVFEYDWASPPATLSPTTVNILRVGYLGQLERRQGTFTAELTGLVHRLRTRIGAVFSPTCRYRFGDAFCSKDLTALTHTGTITAVGGSPHLVATDATQSVASGSVNFGEITWTSGHNDGRQADIRSWQNHTFRLMRPMPYPIQVGDTYTAIEGCDKRFQTCIAYQNAENFGGEPHIPGVDKLHSNDIQAAPQPPPPQPPPSGNGNGGSNGGPE